MRQLPPARSSIQSYAYLNTLENLSFANKLIQQQKARDEFQIKLEAEIQQLISDGNYSDIMSRYDAAFHQDNRNDQFADIRAQVMVNAFNQLFGSSSQNMQESG